MNLKGNEQILEIGCGNGNLWRGQEEKIPPGCHIVLTDVSEGMISDAKEHLARKECFSFRNMDCQEIAYEKESFDVITANHVLFYVKDMKKALSEICRTLKEDGVFYCSTYGREHMKEISRLVKEFDSRIVLSQVDLYEIFGLENGKEQLLPYFSEVEMIPYEDALEIDDVKPLLSYILSCHGNQDEYLNNRYEEFRRFLQGKMEKRGTIHITKQAGVFRCYGKKF
jgi:ubiquinone/menaquinone biosynthesis C-methylase UbiE